MKVTTAKHPNCSPRVLSGPQASLPKNSTQWQLSLFFGWVDASRAKLPQQTNSEWSHIFQIMQCRQKSRWCWISRTMKETLQLLFPPKTVRDLAARWKAVRTCDEHYLGRDSIKRLGSKEDTANLGHISRNDMKAMLRKVATLPKSELQSWSLDISQKIKSSIFFFFRSKFLFGSVGHFFFCVYVCK